MSSNMFSRLVPPGRGSRSIYEELRDQDDSFDVEGRAGLALDEENLNQQFHDYDLDHADGLGVDDSHAGFAEHDSRKEHKDRAKTRWLAQDDEADNDVPASLLVEPHEIDRARASKTPPRRKKQPTPSRPLPGLSTKGTRALWEATQREQRLHRDDSPLSNVNSRESRTVVPRMSVGSPRDMAMWRWVNVTNLDSFIADVYDYYQGNGFWCMILSKVLHLLNVVFIIVFLTFLTQCVDYSKIPESKKMSQILIPQCTKKMSGLWNFTLWVAVLYTIFKAMELLLNLRRLFRIRDFYLYLLNIPEHDMQTISWQDVVLRIMALRDENPKTAQNMTAQQREWIGSQSKERLDAHDIANRLMRRDNFLIALFNKDILDLSIPLPFLQNRQFFSYILEWTIGFAVLDFVFNKHGQVHPEFLKPDKRGSLSQALRTRFLFAGVMNLLFAPFIIFYLLVVYFFNYYIEYTKNPSALGARSYSRLAKWKFREFNELDHLFKDRVNMSYTFAARYMDQFPKKKTDMFATQVAFIAGALSTVLAIASLVDPELFLGFEITHDRTAIFYIGIFTTMYLTARGMVSDGHDVFDPEFALRSVIEYTRYEPDHWKGQLHSFDVKKDFSELYKLRVVIFLEEVLSILITPIILFFSLPKNSDQIIDFFREFTIHVDGLGYVCSFAVFDFKKGVGDKAKQGGEDLRDGYYQTKHGKMAASYYGFLDNYFINPKTGIPGHLPPGMRHQFHPPPAFPGLQSPTLAAEMQTSRTGRRDRPRSRAPAQTPRFGAAMPQPSPMASMLLDPHNHPSASVVEARSIHRGRQRRAGYHEDNILEDPLEDGDDSRRPVTSARDDELYEDGAALDESTWQTSPAKTLSRENSGVQAEEQEPGVLGLIYQFQQAHMNSRPGGVR